MDAGGSATSTTSCRRLARRRSRLNGGMVSRCVWMASRCACATLEQSRLRKHVVRCLHSHLVCTTTTFLEPQKAKPKPVTT